MNRHDDVDQETTLQEQIEQVLTEEVQYFAQCHHRQPIGRESEDVVDNAYSRLRDSGLSYTTVSEAYSRMRCHNAGA